MSFLKGKDLYLGDPSLAVHATLALAVPGCILSPGAVRCSKHATFLPHPSIFPSSLMAGSLSFHEQMKCCYLNFSEETVHCASEETLPEGVITYTTACLYSGIDR